MNIALPDHWFFEFYPNSDIRYNFEEKRPGDKGRWFVPLDLMIGKMLNESTVVSVEISFPLLNDYQIYDFKTEFRIGFFFLKMNVTQMTVSLQINCLS